jgi:hypothetical protein
MVLQRVPVLPPELLVGDFALAVIDRFWDVLETTPGETRPKCREVIIEEFHKRFELVVPITLPKGWVYDDRP